VRKSEYPPEAHSRQLPGGACRRAPRSEEGAPVTQAVPSSLFDPFAPGFTDDPYPQYAVLR
jgi:hypothetical protein